jgi:hypothetical protein|tara:strand:+ start:111 stop:383 length:273 start_codon:yes stop_codon:yes gene_type:complete
MQKASDDVAFAVGDEVRVDLPQYHAPFPARISEIHVWWSPLKEYFVHPDGSEAELSHSQVARRPKDFQIVATDGNGDVHFVPVATLRALD